MGSSGDRQTWGCALASLLAVILFFVGGYLAFKAMIGPSYDEVQAVAERVERDAHAAGIDELSFRANGNGAGGAFLAYWLNDRSLTVDRFLEVCEYVDEHITEDKLDVSVSSSSLVMTSPEGTEMRCPGSA